MLSDEQHKARDKRLTGAARLVDSPMASPAWGPARLLSAADAPAAPEWAARDPPAPRGSKASKKMLARQRKEGVG